MRIAYVDAAVGASGPMLLGALISAGLSLPSLRAAIAGMGLPVTLNVTPIADAPRACRPDIASDDRELRTLRQALALVDACGLEEYILLSIKRALGRWAHAHAAANRASDGDRYLVPFLLPADLAVIVGFLWGLAELGADQLASSPLPMGRGGSTSPVVAELLRGFPIIGADVEGELVTPAAAAILSAWAVHRGLLPAMTLRDIGDGVPPDTWPLGGALRIWLGDAPGDGLELRSLLMLETNIDDMNPQFYDHLLGLLLAAGALDVNLVPMQMKKNRPATLLRVLCAPETMAPLRDMILRETTTLGVRVQQVQRYALPRRSIEVQTPWGTVRAKVAELPDGLVRAIPEYDDCELLAKKAEVPLWLVYSTAQALASGPKSAAERS